MKTSRKYLPLDVRQYMAMIGSRGGKANKGIRTPAKMQALRKAHRALAFKRRKLLEKRKRHLTK